MKTIIRLLWLLLLSASTLFAIDDLKLNPYLDYGSDSIDGPLITGSDAQAGFVSGKTNYIIMYAKDALTFGGALECCGIRSLTAPVRGI
jgi:hypothetical protein